MKNLLEFLKKYKLPVIIIVIVLIIVILLAIFLSNRKTEKELVLSDFEKIAIYNYLENDLLDMQTIYLKSNNSELNDVEMIQVQVQDALDNYFANNPNATSVSTSVIYSILSNDYDIDSSLVDFHGIVLSNYEYNPDTNEIVINNNSDVQPDMSLNAEFANLDNQQLDITKITELPDGQYKVYGNILDNESIISTAEIVLKLENDTIQIGECSIKE